MTIAVFKIIFNLLNRRSLDLTKVICLDDVILNKMVFHKKKNVAAHQISHSFSVICRIFAVFSRSRKLTDSAWRVAAFSACRENVRNINTPPTICQRGSAGGSYLGREENDWRSLHLVLQSRGPQQKLGLLQAATRQQPARRLRNQPGRHLDTQSGT